MKLKPNWTLSRDSIWTISKTFDFEAAHSLPHLPKTHKCHNTHGHSYSLTVYCSNARLTDSMVLDYRVLSEIVNPFIEVLDHNNLNDIFDFPTTAENMSAYIFHHLQRKLELGSLLSHIELKETKKTISELNAEFKTASKAEKRVLIAKDVVKQLNAKAFTAKSGTWCRITNDRNFEDFDQQLKPLLEKNEVKCQVCGVGSLIVSTIRFTNKLTLDEATCGELDFSSMVTTCGTRALIRFFTESQIILIERYFEGGDGYFEDWANSRLEESDKNHVKIFNRAFSATTHLMMIMKNIIKNKGTFVPDQLKF